MKLPINIVYFAWINLNKNFEKIIFGQINDMIHSGILKHSTLYIEICCEHENVQESIKDSIVNLLKGFHYEIKFYNKNLYEYYGIKKLYDLAKIEPKKYYLYLHSKGMFNYDNMNDRHIYEKSLTKGTVYQYKKVAKIFRNNLNISRIGLFPSLQYDKNFIWLNFFWTKGKYLNTCEKPIITDDRFYYERWSGTGDRSSLTYNLFENNFKKYELSEVGDILNSLNGDFDLSK
jgi:hypothetical protein